MAEQEDGDPTTGKPMTKEEILFQLRMLQDSAIATENIEQLAALQCAITMVMLNYDVPTMAKTLGAGDR